MACTTQAHELNSSPAQQSVIMGLIQFPFSLKLFCGFLSDSTPIFGLRRKPYLIIGWSVYILCYGILAILDKPSIVELAVFIFLAGMGFIQADVCTDAMIVERSKRYETIKTRGILQASGKNSFASPSLRFVAGFPINRECT